MRARIVDSWLRISASYWFVPSLMAIVALLAAASLVQLDSYLEESWLRGFDWIYANQPDGARALLSTVAGSMITVAGVTFSITLLAVSHATSQIGPHLLTSFMSDRGNQLTLGTFIATFLYCLLVLRTVHAGTPGGEGEAAQAFVPHLAIAVALLFTMLSVIVLIYFIHHVPQTINVSNVVARVGDDLVRRVERMYPQQIGDPGTLVLEHAERHVPADFEANSSLLRINGAVGYLRIVEDETLMTAASEHDLVIELLRRPGDFALEGQALARAWPAERVTEEAEAAVRSAFSWGVQKTANQDVLFPVQQLLEVMGKALSPGINNQFTALLCIDQLCRGLAVMLRRRIPDRHRVDTQGRLRVIAAPIDHETFAAAVFGPIRQYVENDRIATSHVVDMLDKLRAIPELAPWEPLLAAQAGLFRAEAGAPGG